jgi:hypothetical protein
VAANVGYGVVVEGKNAWVDLRLQTDEVPELGEFRKMLGR